MGGFSASWSLFFHWVLGCGGGGGGSVGGGCWMPSLMSPCLVESESFVEVVVQLATETCN
jgi:hypothetical protein